MHVAGFLNKLLKTLPCSSIRKDVIPVEKLDIDKMIKECRKESLSVEYEENETDRCLKRSDFISINNSIEPMIRQNERERTASMSAAAKCIVGGRL